jgi:16S rRNA (uracil1498-N3)-methyltransferase
MTAGPEPAHLDPGIRSRPLVFVEDLDHPAIDSGDLHHLRRVLRHDQHTPVTLCDGAGGWRTGTLDEVPGDLGPTNREVRRSPLVTVGVALAKSVRSDLVVQKLTELGVDRIVMIRAERSVVRWSDSDTEAKLARMRRVVRESAMQSRRLVLPEIVGTPTLQQFVVAERAVGRTVGIAEPGGERLSPSASTTVVVGPEGGWSPEELSLSAVRYGLGAGVLRVETAAIAVGVSLCAARDGWAPRS